MNILQSFRIALEMLKLHKLRAFLTMLGVIIGVMSVTLIVIVSQGFQSYINTEFKKVGSDTIFVFFDQFRMMKGEKVGDIDSLKIEDVDYIMQRCPTIEMASAYKELGKHNARSAVREVKDISARAIDENYIELNRIDLKSGRYMNKMDNANHANVCVISVGLEKFLFGKNQPQPKPGESASSETDQALTGKESGIGRLVNLPGITLEVVGVVAKNSTMGDNNDKQIYLPLSTSMSKWIGGRKIDLILLRARQGIKSDDAMDDVWRTLMAKSGNKKIYRIDSNESIIKVFNGVIGAAGMILAAIAALSLLVGGIGIMNIMLVSVTERTKEIGLRKAVGAKRAAILTQFVVEAGTLSMVGGLIGMGIAWSLGMLVTFITSMKDWPSPGGLATPFPLPAALMAMGFSALIGMVFGLYPAVSAAKLDPIVALRHE